MGKQSRIKKERRAARLNGTVETKNDLRFLDNADRIPGDVLVAYLLSKFVGKSGYKYISIGRYGSLFMNEQSADIVSVSLHRDYPIVSVRGRFNDPQRRDIIIKAVHVPKDYAGLVLGRDGIIRVSGEDRVASSEELAAVAVTLQQVTRKELDVAIERERPIYEAQLAELNEKVKADAQKSVKAIDEAERQMKMMDAYGNDYTPYATPYDTPYEPITDLNEVDSITVETPITSVEIN